MRKAINVIQTIAERTDRVILFHSASGKDSIALLDLIAPYFREVVCVYMYVIKDLSHIKRYINYACRKYPNVKYIQIPHFATYSYIRTGYMGCERNEKQKLYTMSQLTDIVKARTGIEWAFFGFKQSDSMNRRLMLRGYEMNAINEKSKKCYPLSEYKNGDVLAYIETKGLVSPEKYSSSQSSGTDISDINYLLFLRDNYPEDLKLVLFEYPLVERILFEYDYERVKAKRDKDN